MRNHRLKSSLSVARSRTRQVLRRRRPRPVAEGLGLPAADLGPAWLRQVQHLVDASPWLPQTQSRSWFHRPDCLVFEHLIDNRRIAFDLRLGGGGVGGGGATLSAVGRTDDDRRFLRNALIGRARLVQDPDERQMLRRWPSGTDPAAVSEDLLVEMLWLGHYPYAIKDKKGGLGNAPRGAIATYWWDLKPNFGDLIGPALVRRITGRPVVNTKRVKSSRPTLYTVGSVMGHIDQPGSHIWGSGVIAPLSGAKVEQLSANAPRRIHAVRGRHTRQDLIDKLGWEVPQVFGDPALLYPRFYTPAAAAASTGRVAVVPHYVHRSLFSQRKDTDHFHTVNVRQGPEAVIDDIANATHCLSTSLHGVIIAQAYGVPWTWLHVSDHPLSGDRFKFEDFFSGLDRDTVSEHSITSADIAQADLRRVARAARLPDDRRDNGDLLGAFPDLP